MQPDPKTTVWPGQAWAPKGHLPGLWRVVQEVSGAGVTWSNSRGDKGWTPWRAWFKRMERAGG